MHSEPFLLKFYICIERWEDLLDSFEVIEQGFAIGNGLTDPGIQYKAYTDYALDMGIIQKADYERINKVMVPACEMAIKLCGNLSVIWNIWKLYEILIEFYI